MKMKLLVGLGLVACLCMSAQADLVNYSEDFESLDPNSSSALSDAGWLVFANVFDSGGGYLYGYGPFPAPNGTGGFSNVATNEGGVAQGDNQLVVFSDYNNTDHGVGNLIEANVFQEFTIGAADVGSTVIFSFDAKRGDIQSPTTAIGFIKTLDPTAGFALTNFKQIPTQNISTEWNLYSTVLEIDASLEGQILQIGFASTASNYTPSGVYYDNVNMAIPEPATAGLMAVFGGAIVLLRRYSSRTRLF